MIDIVVSAIFALLGLGSFWYADRCLSRAIATLRNAQAEYQKAQAKLRDAVEARRRAQELHDATRTPVSTYATDRRSLS